MTNGNDARRLSNLATGIATTWIVFAISVVFASLLSLALSASNAPGPLEFLLPLCFLAMAFTIYVSFVGGFVSWSYKLRFMVAGRQISNSDLAERMRTEEELRKSEERFRSLAEMAPGAITIVQGTTIRYANVALETITGYSQEELHESNASRVMFPVDVGEVMERDTRRAEGEEVPHTNRYRLIRKDGGERWVETAATLIEFEGEPAVLGITLDVTERVRAEKELSASESHFRVLAEASQAGILIVVGTRVVYANPAGEALLGRSLAELQTVDYWEVAHPDDREGLMEYFAGPLVDEEVAFPYRYRVVKPDGEERWVEASAATTSFQGENASVVILLEVTERVHAEQAALQAREKLEGKVERQMLRKNPYELTFRELTVLHHVAAGQADKEIAAELGISPLTAQNHVASILRKMDANSRTDAGVRAVRDGLID